MQREGADWGGLTSEAAAPAESGRSSRVYSLAKLGPADSGTPIRTSGPTAGETPLHVGISTSSCGSFHYSCKKEGINFLFHSSPSRAAARPVPERSERRGARRESTLHPQVPGATDTAQFGVISPCAPERTTPTTIHTLQLSTLHVHDHINHRAETGARVCGDAVGILIGLGDRTPP